MTATGTGRAPARPGSGPRALRGVLTVITLGLAASVAQTASAQSAFSVVRDCRAAMGDGDRDAAKRYAEIILGWDRVVSNIQSAAEDCVSYAFDADYRYSPAEGRFVTAGQIEDRRAQREIQAAREALRAASEDLEEQHENRSRALVATSIHEACLALASSNRVAAFTNDVCVEAFMTNGHPDLEPLDDFAETHVRAVAQDLDERQKEEIVRLSDDQVEAICDSSPATACMIMRAVRAVAE